MGRERRKNPRLRFEIPVDIKSGHYLYVARTADISEGGLFINTPAHIRIGSTIHLHLKLERSQTISVIGKVCWHRHDENGEQVGVGVQFEEMSPHARAVLRGFMRTHAPTFYGGTKAVIEPPRPRRPHAEPFRIPRV